MFLLNYYLNSNSLSQLVHKFLHITVKGIDHISLELHTCCRPSGRKLVLGVLGLVIVIYLIIPLLKSGSHRYMVLSKYGDSTLSHACIFY